MMVAQRAFVGAGPLSSGPYTNAPDPQVIAEAQRILADIKRVFLNQLSEKAKVGLKAIQGGNYVTLEQLEKELDALDD